MTGEQNSRQLEPRSEVETPVEARLAELAEVIRREHEATMAAAAQVVVHAVACGEALIEAKTIVPTGEWGAWIERNIPHGKRQSMCRNYMRLAFLKEHVDPELSITSNLLAMTGLPGRPSSTPRVAPEVKAEALRLHGEGAGRAAIARTVGTTIETVRAWTEPGYTERKSAEQRDARHRRRIESGAITALPSPAVDRAYTYGEPGRAAITKAVRKLAQVQGKVAVREALLDLAAIATRWAERLGAPLTKTEDERAA